MATTRVAGNLPVPATAFVGRRAEQDDVRRIFSESRLVTLTGPGGVGKTRLALQVASDVRRVFRDGTWFVDLAALTDPTLLVQSVAAVLDVREQSGAPAEGLVQYLEDKHLLLVLDNCEHVVEQCAALVDSLLQRCRDVRVLATSRHSLRVAGEQILTLAPLPVPDRGELVPLAELSLNEAVSLFVARARSVVPGFELTDLNAPAVAALCARADGLPLAIELTAVMLRALSPEQILARMDERFQLLNWGSRAAQPRQQTLHALMDWSYQLCTPAEAVLWARASVFAGGFDLEAVEAVCTGDGLSELAMLDAVAGLVDKSVLVREEQGTTVRYRLLETVRAFGVERLATTGSDEEFRVRHRDYFTLIAESAESAWFSEAGLAWSHRIRLEQPNLRAALGFSLSRPGEAQAGLRLANALWFVWRMFGQFSEGRRWLDRTLAADAVSDGLRARALWSNGSLAFYQGDYAAARAMLEQAEEQGAQVGDASAKAYAQVFRGQAALSEGALDEAMRLLTDALESFRTLDDPFGESLALARIIGTGSATGDGELARRAAAEYLALCEANGARWLAHYGHLGLAIELLRSGEISRATTQAREAIRSFWSQGDPIDAATGMEVLAWAAAAVGDHERAAFLLGGTAGLRNPSGASQLMGFRFLHEFHEQCVESCVERMGQDAYEAAAANGAAADFDELVAYASGRSTGQNRRSRARSILTKRELEVAELVSLGMSNAEIAATLFISRRTAETHVDHILSKLGFSSRTQIASWMAKGQADGG
ncbi:ATP-binding protein [Nocardioides sp. AN3]